MNTDVFLRALSKLKARRLSSIILAIMICCGLKPAFADGNQLQGGVQETGVLPSTEPLPKPSEPMPVPVLKKKKPQQGQSEDDQAFGAGTADKLYGKAKDKDNKLQGKVEDSGQGQPGGAKGDPGRLGGKKGPLQGSVVREDPGLEGGVAGADPDAGDSELMVEWDRWRNRFLHAVQSGMQEVLNNPSEDSIKWDPAKQAMVSKFPMGTIAWFSCQITPDQRVLHIKLVHSSGYPAYDRAVLDAIDALQGSSILRYPRGSKRNIVTQIAGIKTAETSEYRNFHFGDVERQRVPRGDGF